LDSEGKIAVPRANAVKVQQLPGNPEADRKTHSSADVIVRDIIQGIYEGRFAPGHRLVEADLTNSYRVSRSSVREALQRLAAERIVSVNLHRGAQIRRVTRAEMYDILAVLEVAIGLAARAAAERLAEPNRSHFAKTFEQLLAFEEQAESFELLRARNRFYRALVECSQNGELERILPTLHVHLIRLQHYTHGPIANRQRFGDYRSIGNAVLAGEARRAELAGRRHIRHIAAGLADVPAHLFE
jgi:DNA-binding GntR family transcriptional regulator